MRRSWIGADGDRVKLCSQEILRPCSLSYDFEQIVRRPPDTGDHRLAAITLSHVQCYVPRNTTRASTAFTA